MTTLKTTITGLGLIGILGCAEQNVSKQEASTPEQEVKELYHSATIDVWTGSLEHAQPKIDSANTIARREGVDVRPYTKALVERTYNDVTDDLPYYYDRPLFAQQRIDFANTIATPAGIDVRPYAESLVETVYESATESKRFFYADHARKKIDFGMKIATELDLTEQTDKLVALEASLQ